MNNQVGRPYKVSTEGVGKRVQELRARSYTFQQIADELTKEGIDISPSSIRRYLRGMGKEYSQATPTELVDQFNMMIQDILFKINLMDISKAERKALKHFITSRKRIFEKRLYRLEGISFDTSEDDRMRDWILLMSRELCWDCQKKVSQKAEERIRQLRGINEYSSLDSSDNSN
jgi:hypothetical protein